MEDKIVKFYFSNYCKNKSKESRYYPEIQNEKILFENYKNKIIIPKKNEINENPSSRSAKLRYAIRSKDNYFYPDDLKKKFSFYLQLENTHV